MNPVHKEYLLILRVTELDNQGEELESQLVIIYNAKKKLERKKNLGCKIQPPSAAPDEFVDSY